MKTLTGTLLAGLLVGGSLFADPAPTASAPVAPAAPATAPSVATAPSDTKAPLAMEKKTTKGGKHHKHAPSAKEAAPANN